MTSGFLVLMGGKKVVASYREVIHALLHFRFGVAVERAVLRKKEFSQCGYLDLCVCFESSKFDHYSIYSVSELDAIVIMKHRVA